MVKRVKININIAGFFPVLFSGIVLALGFLIIEKKYFPALANFKTIIVENTSYNWEELGEVYKYAADNVFNKGYFREVGAEIYFRLQSYPDGKTSEKGNFSVSENTAESIIKLALPDGFMNGFLSLQITAKSTYKIGVSPDMKNWKFYDFPGFATRALTGVSLEKTDPVVKDIYLKFLPAKGEKLDIYFDVFQFTSSVLYDKNEHYGVLFFPETDLDYEGKNIIQPAIYGKYYPKKDN